MVGDGAVAPRVRDAAVGGGGEGATKLGGSAGVLHVEARRSGHQPHRAHLREPARRLPQRAQPGRPASRERAERGEGGGAGAEGGAEVVVESQAAVGGAGRAAVEKLRWQRTGRAAGAGREELRPPVK